MNTKIKELTAAKDHMERAMHILRVAGYTQANRDFVSLTSAITGIRSDITGLHTGKFPFIKVTK